MKLKIKKIFGPHDVVEAKKHEGEFVFFSKFEDFRATYDKSMVGILEQVSSQQADHGLVPYMVVDGQGDDECNPYDYIATVTDIQQKARLIQEFLAKRYLIIKNERKQNEQ